MIISRTPLRISFAGGGSDLKEYYKNGVGAVTSTAIDKYIYITVNKKFDDKIRISYSKTEIVDSIDEIKHDLIREALRLTNIDAGIEITSIADIPSKDTGLGSSSSFTVGILNALYAYKGQHKSAEILAKEACKIEIDIVGEPIGKQDQYAAAYGGINHIQCNADGTVFVDPVIFLPDTKTQLNENLMLLYTGLTRKANIILAKQKKETSNKLEILDKMVELAQDLKGALRKNNLDQFGQILHKGWIFKKKLITGITNPIIDKYYDIAIKAGAIGGKILGAGGGGFLLLYCPKENQEKVRKVLFELKETPFKLEPQGSKIIYVAD